MQVSCLVIADRVAPCDEPASDKALGESPGEWLLGELLGR
jgi:hypothetical protein